MSQKMLIILGFALIAVGLFSTGSFSVKDDRVIPLEDWVRQLEVRGYNGSVRWRPLDGGVPRVEIQLKAQGIMASRSQLDEIKITQESLGDLLIIGAQHPKQLVGNMGTSVTYTIYAPQSMLTSFKAVTSNGSISIDDFRGRVDLQTSNGSIRLASGEGVVNLRTSNGSINFDRLALTGSSTIRTSNGKIEGGLSVPDHGDYLIQTSNGSVDLRLPRSIQANLRANTSNGKINWNLPVTLDQASTSATALSGRVNQGGASIQVLTSNGSINFRESSF